MLDIDIDRHFLHQYTPNTRQSHPFLQSRNLYVVINFQILSLNNTMTDILNLC